MKTERSGLEKNRESKERAKKKQAFEKEIDTNEVLVAKEKGKKELKKSKKLS